VIITAQFVTGALVMSILRRGKPRTMSHHSDWGRPTCGQERTIIQG
jgi:hypothetical protein